jgi:cell division protein FtsI (penicillin-binding protein 3)
LLVMLLGLSLLGALVLRFAWLQLVQGPELTQKASTLQSSHQSQAVYRGNFTDRHGLVLAQDALVYDLYAHPAYFKGQSPQAMAQKLAPLLGKPVAELTAQLQSQTGGSLLLGKALPKSTIAAIKALRLNMPVLHQKTQQPVMNVDGSPKVRPEPLAGLDPYQKPLRQFPQNALAAHLLGFVNDEADMASGLHAKLADFQTATVPTLQGTLAVDGRGIPLETSLPQLQRYLQTANLYTTQLTLDAKLQYIAERELAAGLQRSQAKRGTVIIMEPTTAEVLAFATLPSFTPSSYNKAPIASLTNWALTDGYEAGSTMKILTVGMGLESGTLKENDTILDTGTLQVAGWRIRNYDAGKRPYPGPITLPSLFHHSSNVASAKIALGLPQPYYFNALKALHFGQSTGIEATGEATGYLPPLYTWDKSRTASMGYGYGLTSTPLQMAAAVAAVANGGVWQAPRLVKQFEPAVGSTLSRKQTQALYQAFDAQLKRPPSQRVFKLATTQALTRALVKGLELASKDKHPGYLGIVPVAGKTGTALRATEGKYGTNLVTSFVGFFPAYQPKLLVMVVVDDPKQQEAWGSTVAAPIFRNIAMEAIHYYALAPRRTVHIEVKKDLLSDKTKKPTPPVKKAPL